MVIIKLKGGLGNQMFQYAFGREMSLKLKVPLYLTSEACNYRDIESKNKKIFSLPDYKLPSQILIDSFISLNWKNFVKKSLCLPYKKVILEEDLCFNNKFTKAKAPVYLEGYWQSEKYFINYKEVIRNDFSFLKDEILFDSILISRIKTEDSVSVHVRRGDYVNNPDNFIKHGVQDITYYINAFNLIEKKIKQPSYFVFSDDHEWVEKNVLPLRNNITLVQSGNIVPDWFDMYLMTICKHNIIANSTYSWWGAWLNNNSDKVVVAPEKWYALDDLNKQTNDLIPAVWNRV